jgi:hypothetical protein
LLSHAVSIRNFEGQILEFGVASGRTINHISSLTSQKIFGFDVFTGLPEAWRTGFPMGTFSQEGLPVVNKNVELIVGLFESTIDDHTSAIDLSGFIGPISSRNSGSRY